YDCSLGSAIVLATCAPSQKLDVVSFQPEPEKAWLLRCHLFLFNANNPRQHYPVARPAAVDNVAHYGHLDIMRELAGRKILRQLLKPNELKVYEDARFGVEFKIPLLTLRAARWLAGYKLLNFLDRGHLVAIETPVTYLPSKRFDLR